MSQNISMTPQETVLKLFELAFAAEELNINQISQLVSDDYQQYVDEVVLNKDMFLQHLLAQRKKISRVEIKFIAIIGKGNRVFTHHIATAVKLNGEISKVQVLAKFEITDNKISLCDELTELMQGTPEDKELGSIVD